MTLPSLPELPAMKFLPETLGYTADQMREYALKARTAYIKDMEDTLDQIASAFGVSRDADKLLAAVKARTAIQAELDEVLGQIESWSRAYPEDVFLKPDLKKAHAVLTANGMNLDAISADAMRHVITEVWEMLKPFKALQSPSGD